MRCDGHGEPRKAAGTAREEALHDAQGAKGIDDKSHLTHREQIVWTTFLMTYTVRAVIVTRKFLCRESAKNLLKMGELGGEALTSSLVYKSSTTYVVGSSAPRMLVSVQGRG